MRRQLLAAAIVAAGIGSAAACYPDRLDSINYDIIASTHDSSATFAGATYSLRDTVYHLAEPGLGDNINRGNDATILATIRTNMTARGYTEINPDAVGDATADFRLVAAVSSAEYTQYYWDYWCGIYWYGCYYPPYYGSYTYTTGTLFVSMQDRRVVTNGKSPAVWLSLANGLMNTTPSPTRVSGAINTMFQQSPYIDATP